VRHGVRTIVDLRNDDERGPDAAPRPSAVTTIDLNRLQARLLQP
jgi:protein-tyrosine phosphatase